MALQVQEQASQSFSASFELSGSAQQGQLVLLNFRPLFIGRGPFEHFFADLPHFFGHVRLVQAFAGPLGAPKGLILL